MRDMKSKSNENHYFSEQYAHKRLYRYHQTLLVHGQLLFSMASSCIILVTAAYWFEETYIELYKVMAVINCLTIFIIYQMLGVFHQANGMLFGRRRTFLFGLWVLTKAWSVVILAMAFFIYLVLETGELNRMVFIFWSLIGLIVQILFYAMVYFASKRFHQIFTTPLPCLVIGTNDLSKNLISKLNSNIWLAEQVVGVLGSDPDSTLEWDNSAPIVGNFSDIRDVIIRYGIRRVYITLLLKDLNKVEDIVCLLDNQCVDIIWVPDILSIHTIDRSIRELSGLPLLVLSGSPMTSIKAVLIKSLMDRVLAVLLLVALSPVFIATAIAIKLTSPGSVFFKQKRHGWDGREIEIWKFRSMYTPKAETSFELAKRHDPRVTTVGRFIRKTSIDELPQIFNVLQGNMSLVGPRPHAVEVNQFYSQHIPDFMLRHRIKPGITGLAQICGYRGGDDCTVGTLDIMEKRATYDIEYINHWSLLLDLKILLLTPFKIFSHDAY
ncbi:undecaprenyl-phosphate glucose phosphotransferase [Vibrio sp. ABG19]|uniref:undecaprenyl-phosphate glucose phosphotransferase n=1 Tax=Vibrio sp. ABG19 TaxID=2817385 RepID=UPI00249DE3DA|nr:undecaprenyl-phosphate glucose phosphotransferase [Vibrio sp. ABG19]WGY46805.1 undecaprenyl-phosphate glucose phosphotransferase [Vibrio sp. ABG19]